MRFIALSALGILLISSNLGQAQGLIFMKNRAWDPESSAVIIEYKSIEKFPSIWDATLATGGKRRLMPNLVIKEVPYSSVKAPEIIVSDSDASSLSEIQAELQNVVKRWPASKSYLSPYIESAKSAAEQYSKGNVLVERKWITRKQYEANLKAAEQSASELAASRELESQETKRIKKLEMQVRVASLNKEIEELAEKSKDKADFIPISNLSERVFFLLRKLPVSKFSDIYKLGSFAYETETHGVERAILVSNSIRTLESRELKVLVHISEDIDVQMTDGSSERCTVFVQAGADEAELYLKIKELKSIEARLAQLP